jgi:O-antigen/teichoic acid export membrane protein
MRITEKINLGKTGNIISKVFIINILIVSIGLLTNILLARFFGKENFGIYSYFFGLTNLIYIFASFGLANGIAKLTQKDLSKDLLKNVILFLLATSFVISSIIYLVGEHLNLNPSMDFFFWLIFAYGFGVCIFNFMGGSLRRLEKFKLAINFSLYNRIILIILIGFSIIIRNFWFVLLAMSIAILSLIPLEIKKTKLGLNKLNLRNLIITSIPFFLALINMQSMYHIDRISIKYVLDFAQLGYFSAYSNFINILRIGAFTIPFVMITRSSRQDYNIYKSIKKLVILLSPLALIIGLLSPFIVPFLFGAEFVLVNQTLIWSIVTASSLLVIYSLINSIYLGKGHGKQINIILTIDAILSVIINLILNIILISKMGLVGAPIATSIVLIIKIILNLIGLKLTKLTKS